ncbi:uncharacterized protein LOC110892812 [Helianthus annuus]|uniref:uncharacterized protein LOC110892812 n=1 Tax=Helianthus annuus TaxID=4232 RepID=UPI000B90244E|nr:uncharacterized protein LOC110892812 [Helianthus annuus]
MKKAVNPVTNRATIKKLLDSLPKEWSLQCMMIKKDFLNNLNHVTLSDLINTLRAFEMDVNKREMNTAGYTPKTNQTSAGMKNVAFLAISGISQQASDLTYANASASASKAPQPSEKTVTVGDTQALKVPTENVALFNIFPSSYEALMSGELKKEMFTAEDMYQDKTGKRLGLGKAGFDKSKLRCYNCKNLGHFKRDCPLLKEGNNEATPAVKQITIEENKNNASPSTPKALVVEDYDWSEEIAEVKEQVNKALMAKISSGSSSKQFEKPTAGIPKGDNIADKGLKSILNSPEPEKEKKSEEAKEQIPKDASDQKKDKEKVSAAAMKTESSKEKADKDLCTETIEDQDSESSNDDHSCNDSSYEASEEQNSSEYQTFESSFDSDSDEENSEDERRVDKKMKKVEISRHSSHTSSSNTKRPRRKRCFRCGHLGHTAKHCKNKNFSKPQYDFVKNFTDQLDYLKKSVKNLFNSTAQFWKQKKDIVAQNHDRFNMKQVWVPKSNSFVYILVFQNKLQKWLRMLMEYIWHVDSGCSRHMTGLKELLRNFWFIDNDFVSFTGDEKGGKIIGIGNVVSEALTLENVNYVPELCYNLMSVSQVCDKGISVLFNDMECLFLKLEYVVPSEMIMLTAPRQNNTYVLNMKNAKTNDNLTCLISKASEFESLLWHRRLGHVNFKNMNKLSKLNLVRGLPIKEFPFSEKCIACAQGKQHKKSHKSKAVNTITAPLQLMHMDLFGPISVKILAKSSYCLVITDDFSRFHGFIFLRQRVRQLKFSSHSFP